MHGESTIAAKTRPRKRAGHRRSTAEMAPAATEMPAAEMPPAAAEMPSAMAAAMKMPATVAAMATSVAAAMTTAAMTTAATFRDGIARGRQSGRKNKDGNSNSEF
jgi:hypothetical protein